MVSKKQKILPSFPLFYSGAGERGEGVTEEKLTIATVRDIRHKEGFDRQRAKGEASAHVGLLVRVDALVLGEATRGAKGAEVDDVGVWSLAAGVVGGGCEGEGGKGGGAGEGGEGGDGEVHFGWVLKVGWLVGDVGFQEVGFSFPFVDVNGEQCRG